VLEGTVGKLLVDGYDGYNKITLPGGRERAGCWAHARRKFFEAQSSASVPAKIAMDFILELYKVERAALDTDLLGTPEHLAMRHTRSRAVVEEFKAWLEAEKGRHPPRSAMGAAIGYALGQWDALTLFLTDVRASPPRQQPLRTGAPRRGPRAEELPLRRLGRSRREPGRPLLAHRDVRDERREPGQLSR
jgi:hypothetical protein